MKIVLPALLVSVLALFIGMIIGMKPVVEFMHDRYGV